MRCRARLPPSASISFHSVSLLPSSSSLIPVGILHRSRFQPPCSFCPTNSILAIVAPTHFQSSPLLPTSGSIRISISMRAIPESIRSHPFNITRSRTVFVRRRIRPYASFESRIEKLRHINLFRLTIRATAKSRELLSAARRQPAASRVNLKSITFLFSLFIVMTKQGIFYS